MQPFGAHRHNLHRNNFLVVASNTIPTPCSQCLCLLQWLPVVLAVLVVMLAPVLAWSFFYKNDKQTVGSDVSQVR